MSELKRLQETLAEALGEAPEAIKATNPQWLKLMKEGVLVNIHIGRWRAKTGLSWDDLGIKVSDETNKVLNSIINLGSKNLLPAEVIKELDSLESKARRLLVKSSFQTYWGRFIPVGAYAEWKADNDELIAEYFTKRDEIVANYDQLIYQVMVAYEAAARSSYERLKALAPESIEEFPSETEFVNIFTSRVNSKLPTAQDVHDSFYYSVELNFVPLPDLLATEQAEAERVRLEAQHSAEVINLAAQTTREKEWAEQKRIRDEAWAEHEKKAAEVKAAQSAAEVKQRMLEEMNRDVIEQARQQKESLVDDFLRNVVSQLRNLVYDATTDVLSAMTKKGSLPPRSIVQLKKMVEQVGSLNFYGDQEIDQMIRQVTIYLNQNKDDRELPEIQDNLRNVATVIRSSLIGLGESPRSARELGIPDVPAAELVRTARRGLGLVSNDVEIESTPVRRQRRLVE